MLIIAISAIATVDAQPMRKQVTNNPANVIKQLNFTINNYGQKDNQSYSIKKNPNTNIIESSEKIVHFSFRKTADSQQLGLIRDAFTKDESVSYQFKHIAPGNRDFFSINVLSENGALVTQIPVRTSESEEMWYMCCKNTENPQLRDAYAIAWVEPKGEGMVEGYIYMITSLRPDIYEQSETSSNTTFKIDGRVGYDLTDSLYVFYMADTYEELNEITTKTDSYEELKGLADHEHVVYMPVVNKHFGLCVEINKRKVGRIRTVMPDGSLCKLWTNIDMVPGETYRITTHNGYYDEDRDYEQREGRYSGKSMFVGRDYDDVEITGGYNDDVVASTVVIDESGNVTVNNPLDYLAPAQQLELIAKTESLKVNLDLIEALFKTIGAEMRLNINNGGKVKEWKNVDEYFNQISKQNKVLDKKAEELLATASRYDVRKKGVMFDKAILEILSEQNNNLNTLFKKFGSLSKVGTKCQMNVNKITEKYLKEMRKTMAEQQSETSF